MSHRFEKHARTVTLLTLVSRMTGLARDAALSRIFGVSPLMDAFWFAFMIPNLFRRLFGEGALSSAFLPVYTRLHASDPASARRLASLTLGLMVATLGGLTLIAEIVLFILSMRAGHDHLALRLMEVMLPYMPLVCLVAIIGAMLQVHGRFGPTAAAPILLNLFIVVAAIGFASRGAFAPDQANDANHKTLHITIVAASVLAAGIVQVAWSLLALRRTGAISDSASPPILKSPDHPIAKSFKEVLSQFWPMFIGLGVLQVNTFVDGLIASWPSTIGPTIFGYDFPLDPGALTALSNAQRLYEFPLGVFGIAVATAIFPALARAAGDGEMFADILRRGLRLVIFIGLPASVGLILVRTPLTAAILQGKNFTEADTARVGFVLMGYAPAIWAYSMTHTLTRAFYAKGDSKTPVKVAVTMVLLNFALNMTLIWTPLKEAGLAWSTAGCAIVQVGILLRLTRRHASHIVNETVLWSWMKTVLVTAVMAIAVMLVAQRLPARWVDREWSAVDVNAMINLAILVATGAATVIASSLILRMPELAWAAGKSRSV